MVSTGPRTPFPAQRVDDGALFPFFPFEHGKHHVGLLALGDVDVIENGPAVMERHILSDLFSALLHGNGGNTHSPPHPPAYGTGPPDTLTS